MKVGSSLWNRLSALEKLPAASRVLGRMARLITGSGTFMDVIVYLHSGGTSAEEHAICCTNTALSGKKTGTLI